MVLAGDGVTDPRLADILHAGDQVADLADPDLAGLDQLGLITPTSSISCTAPVDIIFIRSRWLSLPSITRT